jgi:hypothetical protein
MGREFLTPYDIFRGELLPMLDPTLGCYTLLYLTGITTHNGGKFRHFKAQCIVGASESEAEVLELRERLLDEGGVIPEVKTRRRRKRVK